MLYNPVTERRCEASSKGEDGSDHETISRSRSPSMTRTASVMVTAAGTIVAQGIIKGLRLANSRRGPVRYRIIAGDMSALAPGIYRSDVGVILPPASSADYIDSVVRCCKREKVSAVFCGSEEEATVLDLNRRRLIDEADAVLISNSGRVIAIGADKWKTYRFLKSRGLPCAESALPAAWREFVKERGLPVVVKPRSGHGSIGVEVARSRSEVASAIERLRRSGSRPIVQEFLSDEDQEYTSGVMTGPDGEILSSISMRRKLKGGQTSKAFVEEFPRISESAERVAMAMGSRGPLNVQARMDEGEPKVFEVNPRFSASTPIRAAAGVNEPDVLFRSWVLGERARGRPARVREIVAMRYFNEVYVDRRVYDRTVERGRRADDGDSFVLDYF